MTFGALILLGLAAAEVITIVKLGKQAERIEKLEKQIAEKNKT